MMIGVGSVIVGRGQNNEVIQPFPNPIHTHKGGLVDTFFMKDWVQMQGTMSVDTVNVKEGKESIKLTGVEGESPFIRSFRTYDFSDVTSLVFRFFVDGDPSNVYSIDLFFPNDSAFENLISHSIMGETIVRGWNEVVIHRDDFAVEGTGSLDLPVIRFQVRTNFMDGIPFPITFDSLSTNAKGKANVLLTFDDQWSEQYTIAFEEMRRRGLVGTIAVNGGTVGQEGYMTWEQLQEVHSYGWGTVNHTENHLRLPNYTLAQQKADIQAGAASLEANNLPGGDILFYPYGAHDEVTLQAVEELEIKSSRSIKTGIELTPPLNKQSVKIFNLLPSFTSAKPIELINEAISFGGTVVFLAHRFGTEGDPDNMFWDTGKFIELLDHIAAKNQAGEINVATYNEWVSNF